jgi:DNA-binding LytR/AlgR family response regulator
MAKKILIIEDEPIIAIDIAQRLENLGYEVIGSCKNAEDSIMLLNEQKPDLILLDIILKGKIDGIQLAGIINLEYNIPFIYLTAFYDKETKERAKKTDPYAFLIKPFNDDELQMAIDLAFDRYWKEKNQDNFYENADKHMTSIDSIDLNEFFMKTGNQEFQKIKIDHIDFIEAFDIYSYFYLDQKKLLVNISLKDIENRLKNSCLFRIHRSYIINIKKLDSIKGNLALIKEKEIPIGGSYKLQLFEKLNVI